MTYFSILAQVSTTADDYLAVVILMACVLAIPITLGIVMWYISDHAEPEHHEGIANQSDRTFDDQQIRWDEQRFG